MKGANLIARLIGLVLFGLLGIYGGLALSDFLQTIPDAPQFSARQVAITVGLLGAVLGFIFTPLITIRPLNSIRAGLTRLSLKSLVAVLIGLTVGLIIAALLAFPLSLLPTPFGDVMPFIGVILFGYLGILLFTMREEELLGGLPYFRKIAEKERNQPAPLSPVLLDTSVIIDGRIADIARTGFIPGFLLIPRFVLNELQFIADSADSMRRQRGRRGLEVLAELQRESAIQVQFSDADVEGLREVDEKLIVLGRQMSCPILTNDYNLNRIADLQGVAVLNINELANAVKSILLPGELLEIRVIQEGKEVNQGVGYLDDGTMVVIENGKDYLDQQITVEVTKVLQTAAGRMIFARPARD